MKYHIISNGDADVGIDSFHDTVELRFDDDRYDIEFYNDLEKDFMLLLKEKYDNGTKITVITDYDYNLEANDD